MPPRQKPLTRGRWSSIALSLLLHSAIVATAVFAWKYWKSTPPPVETVAIEGTLVDESALKGAKPAPEPAPPEPTPAEPTPPVPEPEPLPTPAPEDVGPPKPDPAEVERKAQEKLEQERLEQQKREQEQKAEQERIENEKQAKLKAAAEKAAADKAAAEKKKAEEAKKRAADEAAAKKRAADEAAAKKAADELRRSLEAEERGRALQNSDAAARWHAQIVAKIQRAWIKPPSAQPGISCTVLVTQVPGGEVTSVRVDSCNGGDAALRESVERAVYNASPLPSPPDTALFERNLELTFAPTS